MNNLHQTDSKEWGLYKYNVKYTKDGASCEQYTNDFKWYEIFATMYENFTVDEVIVIEYTSEQLARLAEIQDLSPKFYDEIYNYVINRVIKVDSEIFAMKNLKILQDTINGLILLSLEV